jgi:hypothetical protein
MKIPEDVQHSEKTKLSFLQDYLVFFLLGIVCFYLYFIIFIKLNFPYDNNHIHRYYKVISNNRMLRHLSK